MNCRDFERLWQQRLDEIQACGRSASPPTFRAISALRPEADAHAASCPKCRTLAAGYLALAQAIGSLPPIPEPDLALSSRILSAWEQKTLRAERLRPVRPVGSPRPRAVFSWLAAAAAILLTLGGLSVLRNHVRQDRPAELAVRPSFAPLPAPPPKPLPHPRPLQDVLSDAATATLALARETSAPAARLGRDVIGSASEVVGPPSPLVPILPDGQVEPISQTEGETQARLRPWSAPARNAFGFLIPRLPPSSDRHPEPPPDTQGQPG